MLRKDAETSWTEDCQKAFDKIKEYLSTPPVLVPPEPGQPLILYLSILDGDFGCVFGQHDETGRKEQAIYYLSKNSEVEALLLCLYYIPHIKDGPSRGHVPETHVDWKVGQVAVKGQALADHLVGNPVGEAYEHLKTYFLDEKVSFVEEDIIEAYDEWEMFFDGVANFKGVGIGAVLVQGEWATKNSKILPYLHHV
ncbi:uncharacterized protein [Nicotiana sylvestris]|uniref:uncharacterized protein n=1 Tax=Nicotiana sylvestris TaxID=4096 RepID=UPI00388C961C